MAEFTVRSYRVHDTDFLAKLAIAVLDGKAMVNWSLDDDAEEIAFLPVKQATPQEIMELRQKCDGLFFFALNEWALPHVIRGLPVFHTVEPLSREEVEKFIYAYKDEKARRIANGAAEWDRHNDANPIGG